MSCNTIKKSSLRYILIIISFFLIYNCSEEKSTNGSQDKDPEVVITPDPLYFGRIPAGQSMQRQFLISNVGGSELSIPQLNIEGMDANLFSLVDVAGELKVGINKTILIKVNFTPTTAGEYDSQVKIDNNAASSPDYANLSGISTAVSGDNIIFERIIGGIDGESSSKVLQTSDGGFILSGSSRDDSADVNVAELTRLDKYGNVLWRKQFPGSGLSGFNSLVIDDDEGFIAVGQTSTSVRTDNDVYIVKTDQNGLSVWETIWGEGDEDKGTDLVKVADGFVVSGETNNVPEGRGVKDLLIVKFDGNGNFVWKNNFGNAEGEGANSIYTTNDNGFILSGFRSTGANGFDHYLVRVDASGNSVWEKTYGSDDWEVSNAVVATDDGGFLNAGYQVGQGSGGRDVYLLKTDADGNELWTKNYGGAANDEASALIKTNDGNFMVVGNSESFQEGISDVYLLKIDQDGDLIWEKNIGGDGGDGASNITEIAGGYVICGSTSSFSKSSAIYVLRVNSSGSF